MKSAAFLTIAALLVLGCAADPIACPNDTLPLDTTISIPGFLTLYTYFSGAVPYTDSASSAAACLTQAQKQICKRKTDAGFLIYSSEVLTTDPFLYIDRNCLYAAASCGDGQINNSTEPTMPATVQEFNCANYYFPPNYFCLGGVRNSWQCRCPRYAKCYFKRKCTGGRHVCTCIGGRRPIYNSKGKLIQCSRFRK